MRHHKQTKSLNYRHRERKIKSEQWYITALQEELRGKLPQSKKTQTHTNIRSTQNTNYTGPENKLLYHVPIKIVNKQIKE